MRHRSLRSAVAGRGFMLFPAAAYAVHEGRYRLGYGADASQALAVQGHGYLDSLAPWVTLLLALACGSFLLRVARAATGSAPASRRRGAAGLWLLSWAGLLGVYIVQEWLEGLFAAGHPGGLAGIFGHGGGWAVALSAVAALAVTALLRLSAATVALAARLAHSRAVMRRSGALRRPLPVFEVRRAPLAGIRSGRAPPARLAAAPSV